MKNQKGFLQIGFILVSIILIIAVGFIFYLFGKGEISLGNLLPSASSSPMATMTPSPKPVNQAELIKEAVYQKTGLTSDELDVTVSKIEGDYATGGLKEKAAIGGAYFIAAKTDLGWVVVYDGQSTPTCKQLDLYDFPVSLAPQCMTASGSVVDR